MSFRLRTAAVAAIFGLVLAACGGSTPVATGVDGAEAPAENSAGSEVSYQTVSGAQISLNSLEGQDTVLWFWAAW